MNSHMSDDDTVEHPAAPVPPDPLWPETGSSQVQVDLAAVSDRGLVRENNQDHYLVVRIGRSLETLLTNLLAAQVPARAEEVAYGLVVADGMGGHVGGAVASQMAITTLVSLVLQTPDWNFGEEGAHRVMDRMADRFCHIDTALRARAGSEPNLKGMGTTMTLAVSLGAGLVIG